jgi:hypothetical protein
MRLVCAATCPGLRDGSISSMAGVVVVSWQRPGAVCAAALPGLLHVLCFFGQCTNLCSLLPGLTAAVEARVYCTCNLCRCHVMTSVATLHQQRPGGVGNTCPAPGRLVADLLLYVPLLRVRVFR